MSAWRLACGSPAEVHRASSVTLTTVRPAPTLQARHHSPSVKSERLRTGRKVVSNDCRRRAGTCRASVWRVPADDMPVHHRCIADWRDHALDDSIHATPLLTTVHARRPTFSITKQSMSRRPFIHFAFVICAIGSAHSAAVAQTSVQHGKRYPRMVIRDAMVIDGMGTPASGPYDIVIENNRITQMFPLADAVTTVITGMGTRPKGDVQIDAKGKYVLPGLINAHVHVQDERGGTPQELEYDGWRVRA